MQNSHYCRDDSRIVVTTRIETNSEGEVTRGPLWIAVLRNVDQYKKWYGAVPVFSIQLYVHEARHVAVPHTCVGGKDQTFAEMGAWAYAWYTMSWFENCFEPMDFLDSGDR